MILHRFAYLFSEWAQKPLQSIATQYSSVHTKTKDALERQTQDNLQHSVPPSSCTNALGLLLSGVTSNWHWWCRGSLPWAGHSCQHGPGARRQMLHCHPAAIVKVLDAVMSKALAQFASVTDLQIYTQSWQTYAGKIVPRQSCCTSRYGVSCMPANSP